MLYLGYNSGSTGTYNLSGTGQLSANWENIGYSGTGTFTQTGGTNSPTGLSVGNAYGSGTYNLSGTGKLSTGTEGISRNGMFTQTGGTNEISEHFNLSSGTYILNTGLLITATTEYIGRYGLGILPQTIEEYLYRPAELIQHLLFILVTMAAIVAYIL